MNIRNHTSGVPVETTVARIESKLAAAGVSHIHKHYDPKGRVAALVFSIRMGEQYVCIKLPANVEACHKVLLKEYRLSVRKPRLSVEKRIMEQAERTAWKLMQEWLEVQISLILLQQAEWMQVFLGYIVCAGQTSETYFERCKTARFAGLLAEKAA